MIVAGLLDRALPMLARIAAIAIVVVLAALTIAQTGVWLNDRALFLHALAVNPRSFMAQANLASDALRSGDLAEAEFRLGESRNAEPFMEFNFEMLKSQLDKTKRATSRPAK